IIWVRKAANFSCEWRFSVTRDVVKLSLFVESAVWGQIPGRLGVPNSSPGSMMNDPKTGVKLGEETLRIGVTGGPGIHLLLQGDFQLDIYGSFGVASPDLTKLQKVFG